MAKKSNFEVITKLRNNKYVIFCIYSNGKEYKHNTGLNANSTTFQNGQFTSKYGIDYKEMNALLQGKKNHINELIKQAYDKGIDKIEYVKNTLEQEQLNKHIQFTTQNQTILEAFELYIEHKKQKKINQMSEKTYQRYLTEVKRIKRFDTVTKLCNFDMDWMNKYVAWLAEKKTITLEVENKLFETKYTSTKISKAGNTTIKRTIQDLITFCKNVTLNNSNIKFPIDEYTSLMNSLKSDSGDLNNLISMSQVELNAFRNHKQHLKHQWEIDTYNAYLVGVNTGLRYCDIRLLSNAHINTNNNQINISNEKTNFHVIIPLKEEVKEILNYYNGTLVGKIPTIQRLNINLRKILSKIDIFQKDEIEYTYVLKDKIATKVKRWERFTFHTSRKTFVTLAINNKATHAQLRRWIGWTDFRTIKSYMDAFNYDQDNDLSILNF